MSSLTFDDMLRNQRDGRNMSAAAGSAAVARKRNSQKRGRSDQHDSENGVAAGEMDAIGDCGRKKKKNERDIEQRRANKNRPREESARAPDKSARERRERRLQGVYSNEARLARTRLDPRFTENLRGDAPAASASARGSSASKKVVEKARNASAMARYSFLYDDVLPREAAEAEREAARVEKSLKRRLKKKADAQGGNVEDQLKKLHAKEGQSKGGARGAVVSMMRSGAKELMQAAKSAQAEIQNVRQRRLEQSRRSLAAAVGAGGAREGEKSDEANERAPPSVPKPKKKYYEKKSTKRLNELYEKYKELSSSKKLDDYMRKKRRRNAAKMHTLLPMRRER